MLKKNNQLDLNFSKYLGLYDIIIKPDNFWKQLNDMVDFSFVYEELIRQAKDLRKSVYKINESMHEKMPKKKELSGLLEDQIEYTKELLKVVKNDGRFTVLPGIKEQIEYLEETMNDTKKNNYLCYYYYRRKA